MDEDLNTLARELQNRLMEFLGKAGNAVVPPGTLAPGMRLSINTEAADNVLLPNGIQVEGRVIVSLTSNITQVN